MTEAELRWEIVSEMQRVRWLAYAARGRDPEGDLVDASNALNARTSTRIERERALAALKAWTPEGMLAHLQDRMREFDNDINSYRPKQRAMTEGDL